MPLISFVIPCYNSEKTLATVVGEIEQVMHTADGHSYEIILINDNSPDGVYSVIKQLSEDDSKIKAINFAKNFGQHSALLAGYRYAKGDIIVSVDDDGQIPIEDTMRLVDKVEQGYDVVYANYPDSERGAFRNLGSRVNDVMAQYLLSKPKEVEITSFFAMKRFIAEEMIRYNNPYPYLGGLVFRATLSIASVEVTLRPRPSGASGYTFKKLLKLWLNGFTAFSVRPLRLATILGFLVALGGAFYVVYIIVNRFLSPQVPLGYSSTMAALLLIGGIIMCMLGLIGEYIGRIYISLNNSPQYVIRETINIKE